MLSRRFEMPFFPIWRIMITRIIVKKLESSGCRISDVGEEILDKREYIYFISDGDYVKINFY